MLAALSPWTPARWLSLLSGASGQFERQHALLRAQRPGDQLDWSRVALSLYQHEAEAYLLRVHGLLRAPWRASAYFCWVGRSLYVTTPLARKNPCSITGWWQNLEALYSSSG